MTQVISQGTMNSINLNLNLNNNNNNSSNSNIHSSSNNNKESLISLDKEEIVFDLNQVPNDVISNSSKITNNLSQSVSYKSKNALRYSQLLTIHNNTSHTLGVKIYFVIEEYFAASPRSFILSSQSNTKVDIKFYYNKHKINNGDINIKSAIQSNKMKIEAFVIPNEYINNGDVSDILKQLKEKKIQIKKNSIKLHTRIIFKHNDDNDNDSQYNSMNNKQRNINNIALKMSIATAKSEISPEEEKELKDLDNEISKLKVIYNDLICKYNEMTKKYLNKTPKTSPTVLPSDTSSFLTNPTFSSRIIPFNILIILSLISFLIGIYFTA
jgi:hypothetical protein